MKGYIKRLKVLKLGFSLNPTLMWLVGFSSWLFGHEMTLRPKLLARSPWAKKGGTVKLLRSYTFITCRQMKWNRIAITGKWSLTWTSVHGVPLHTLAKGEGGYIGVGVDALLHVAAPHALWAAAAGAFAASGSHGAGCPALLGTVVGCKMQQTLLAQMPLWDISLCWTPGHYKAAAISLLSSF